MEKISFICVIALLFKGVVTDESVSVMEGDSVTLYTDTKIQRYNLIEWRFGHQQNRIARINRVANSLRIYDDVLDGRFRDRLQVNNQTGDLIITNFTTQHTGLYQLDISTERIMTKRFSVCVVTDDSVSVMEGDSVTLHTDITDTQTNDLIDWRFGDQEERIAKLNKAANSFKIYDDALDGRFRDRLQVNNQTGDLIITNITTQHTGLYKLDINRETFITKTFSVYVSVDKVKTVMKGDSVILVNNITKKPGDERIVWRIRHNNSPVAEINGMVSVHDERFRGRLQVDYQTGDLIITNIRPEDFGSYEVDITVGSNTHTIHRLFSVRGQDTSSGLSSGVTAVICVVFLGVVAVAVVFINRHRICRATGNKQEVAGHDDE